MKTREGTGIEDNIAAISAENNKDKLQLVKARMLTPV